MSFVVVEVFVCSLCSESHNTNLLLNQFIASHTKHFALQHGGVYLVTVDREFSDVIAPYL